MVNDVVIKLQVSYKLKSKSSKQLEREELIRAHSSSVKIIIMSEDGFQLDMDQVIFLNYFNEIGVFIITSCACFNSNLDYLIQEKKRKPYLLYQQLFTIDGNDIAAN